jgi:hypothetical protein
MMDFQETVGSPECRAKHTSEDLEAKTLRGFAVVQVHTPLLKDPRTRQFFHHWGMVPGKKDGEKGTD